MNSSSVKFDRRSLTARLNSGVELNKGLSSRPMRLSIEKGVVSTISLNSSSSNWVGLPPGLPPAFPAGFAGAAKVLLQMCVTESFWKMGATGRGEENKKVDVALALPKDKEENNRGVARNRRECVVIMMICRSCLFFCVWGSFLFWIKKTKEGTTMEVFFPL